MPPPPLPAGIAHRIEQAQLGRLQIGLAVLCGLAVMLDGFDVLVISYVAPALVETFQVRRALLGPVFSAALLGTTLGALAIAPLADRAGHKSTLIGCVLLFGLATLATAAATSLRQVLLWRFLGGLGLGGSAPIAVALLAGFAPVRARAPLIILMYCGYSVGAAGGGLVAAWLLGVAGWRAVFVAGGLLPLLLAAVMARWLPESIGHLLRRGRHAEAARLLARLAPGAAAPLAPPAAPPPPPGGVVVWQLFRDGRAPRTLLLWLMFFANILALYFMTAWLPTLVNAAGLPLRAAVLAATLVQVGSIAGTVLLAGLVGRWPVFRVLGGGFLLGAVALVLLGRAAGGAAPWLPEIAFAAGFLVIGTQTAANAASALIYPAAIRATGVGWALGIGRIGAILGPGIGGALVALDWTIAHLFLLAAAPAALAGLLALVLARLLARGRSPDDAEDAT